MIHLTWLSRAAAASLFILPESPRWLVVNGHLDVALAVIHRVFTKSVLPAGCTPAPLHSAELRLLKADAISAWSCKWGMQ